jgi:[ribosomal protein S5]-alanine N-acetyltransferase
MKREVRLELPGINGCLRRYLLADVPELQRIADDARVSRWMSASFPHPYTLADAEWWFEHERNHDEIDFFAIEVDGALAGGAGLEAYGGSHAGVAMLGYWFGVAYWGRGIATATVHALVDYAFARRFRRIEAYVFAPNIVSARVLEKCGFTREACLRDSYVERDGTVCDKIIFARLRSDFVGTHA